jgi:hypothetical protein
MSPFLLTWIKFWNFPDKHDDAGKALHAIFPAVTTIYRVGHKSVDKN